MKSLINRQCHILMRRYPNVSFGILTGDIEYNTNANVIFASAEIVANHLLAGNTMQIDFEKELGCLIMDKMEFIMDKPRFNVWETTIMTLPKCVPMLMLCSNLDNSYKFATWCETIGEKDVCVSCLETRKIPLSHYNYITSPKKLKRVRNKFTREKISNLSNNLVELKSNNQFHLSGYNKTNRIKLLLAENNIYMDRKHVLNNLAKSLKDNDLLPCVFYTFNRKNVVAYAQEVTTQLFDNSYSNTRDDIEQKVADFIPNFRNYQCLREFETLINLLQKGIGIYHSGMIPILKELVEAFVSKGYIKILFATSSFGIGVDSAMRTSVFTSLKQFDGESNKYISPWDYSQMSSRCGRHNIDDRGFIIHCNNMFNLPNLIDYAELLSDKPLILQSKFSLSYYLILNVIKQTVSVEQYLTQFFQKSLKYVEMQYAVYEHQREHDRLFTELDSKELSIKYLKTPRDVLEHYISLIDSFLPNKKKNKLKDRARIIAHIVDEYKFCIQESVIYRDFLACKNKINVQDLSLSKIDNFIPDNLNQIFRILFDKDFIKRDSSNNIFLTSKGEFACQMTEIHPLIITDCIGVLKHLSAKQIVSSLFHLSYFDPIHSHLVTHTDDSELQDVLDGISTLREIYTDYEDRYDLDTAFTSTRNLDILSEIEMWYDADCTRAYLYVIEQLQLKNIDFGDFSKALLKICAISKELIIICDSEEFSSFRINLSQIKNNLLKFVCNNDSLIKFEQVSII